MTHEEAIKTIKVAVAEVEWNYPMNYSVAFETAINALEKQIPKKPIVEKIVIDKEYFGRTYKVAKCPNCKEMLGLYNFAKESFQCCCKCGKALDWGDTE